MANENTKRHSAMIDSDDPPLPFELRFPDR